MARTKKQRETNNQTFDLDMAEICSSTLVENLGKNVATHSGPENRLNNEHIAPIQEVLQWSCTSERKFKRNTENMPFIITCRTWKAWFQGKENKKKEELAKLEGKKEGKRKKQVKKDTACKSSIGKRGICFNCTKIVKLTDTACSLFNKCFHKKCVSHHRKMHIHWRRKRFLCLPCVFSKQTVLLTWLWMLVNNHNILNYVTVVCANNCTAWWQ